MENSSFAARSAAELPPPAAPRPVLDDQPTFPQQQFREDFESSRLVSGGVGGDGYSYQAAPGGGGAAETVSGRVEEQLEPTGAYEQQYEESVRRPGYEPQYEPPEQEQPPVQQEPPERPPNKTLSRGPSQEAVNDAPRLVSSRPPSGGSSRTPSSPSARGRGVKQP